jgi:hypothetical protein
MAMRESGYEAKTLDGFSRQFDHSLEQAIMGQRKGVAPAVPLEIFFL